MRASLRSGGSFSLEEGTSTSTNSLPQFVFSGANEPGYGGAMVFTTNSTGDALVQGAAVANFQAQLTGSGAISNANAFTFRNFSTLLMRISASGDVTVGNLSAVGASARFHIRGSNPSSGTNALLVQNSTPSDLYKIENDGKISYLANAISGTTGNRTINTPSGNVNFAIGATALTVNNSLCTTSSLVFATIRTNDATAIIKNVVPAAGSFTINLDAAATGVTSVGFFIIN
jgi:hypothetical protein